MRKCMETGEKEIGTVTGPEVGALNKAGGGTYRNQTIDIIKAIGIILMVWGHTEGPFINFIGLFHMPIFWMASGYFWNEKNAVSIRSVRGYIWKKIKSLYIPYVITNCFFTLFQNVFILLKITDASAYKGYKEIGILLLKKFLLIGTTSDFGTATWFLRVLFLVSVGHVLLCFVANKKSWGKYIRLAAIIVAMVMAGIVNYYRISIPFQIHAVFSAYLCYILGIFFRKYQLEKYLVKHQIVWMFGSFLALCIMNRLGSVGMVSGQQTSVLFLIVCASLGWTMLWEAAMFLKGKIGRCFAYIGKRTISILILHLISFKLVTLAYCLIAEGNINRLIDFPILHGETFLWPIYTIVGVLVPVLLMDVYLNLKNRVISVCQNL